MCDTFVQLSESFLRVMSAKHGTFLERHGQSIQVKGKGLMKTYSLQKRHFVEKVNDGTLEDESQIDEGRRSRRGSASSCR